MMANLLALPNELLLNILLSSPDARTASRLSQVNKRLQDIWTQSSNQILTSIFQRDIITYDEALNLAKAELLLEAENLDKAEIDIRQLVGRLMASQEMLARILPLYERDFEDILHYGYVYDAELSARAYFCCRFVVLAHDHKHMRRGVRRWLRRLSEDELRYYTYFLEWFVDDLGDQYIRDWHELGLSADDTIDKYSPDGFDIPMKWHFTTDTVNLQCARKQEPGVPIGKDGLWSNKACQGFQESWW